MSDRSEMSERNSAQQPTPLSEALRQRSNRRQQQIRDYQEAFGCRLVVLLGEIGPYSVAFFEETLFGADPAQDLHVMLDTPGGDGETAVRLVRQAQARCNELTVIVPDQAKSAGTLFVLGAHHIFAGHTSDLGPVDPQLPMPDGTLVAAKTIIAAVEHAEEQVRESAHTFELHAFLLGDVSALQVQEARDALGRSNSLVREALASCPGRNRATVDDIAKRVSPRLINEPESHSATISARDAEQLGMPIIHADPSGDQWKRIWRLWSEYVAISETRVYESEAASYVFE